MSETNKLKMPISGEMPSIQLKKPQIYRLENGLTLMVIENRKFPKISVQLVMDIPPVFQTKKGVQLLTSMMMGEGSQFLSKADFHSEIEQMGAFVSLATASARIETLSRYFPRVMELFAQTALHPNFNQEELDAKRSQAIERIRVGENSVTSIADRVNNILIYTENHPFGSYATEASLESITLAEIKNFYRENFTPNKTYMVISGDISLEEARISVEKNFGKWKSFQKKETSLFVAKNLQKKEIDLVSVPLASQAEVNVFNLQTLTMANEDYFAVLIMNYILGGGFGSYINLNLREDKGYTYGARSFMGVNKWTNAVFGVSTKVNNQVVGHTLAEILKEIKRIQNELVTAEKLAEAKAQYIGWFVLSTENEQTAGRFALNIEIEKLPTDFYENYLKKIEAVTISDIQRVANKYILFEQLRMVVVGQGDIIVPQITDFQFENEKIPLRYFDKWGKELCDIQ